jgi:hypothetical protein
MSEISGIIPSNQNFLTTVTKQLHSHSISVMNKRETNTPKNITKSEIPQKMINMSKDIVI